MGNKQKHNQRKKKNQSKLHSLTYYYYDVPAQTKCTSLWPRPVIIPFMNKEIHNRFIDIAVHSTERCLCTHCINNYGQCSQSYQLLFYLC